ncbi:hypothetical protein TVAG_340250 [Trichomonas vaginalis G3]|uniref:Transcription factor CBF/NF-Y/archaeal histone domain-containing protein n=1 Tax=Trichomonas vaginalis (strain ATCC PRA-98 / G3) TaxID=412133 RepID=A2EKD9_TRIV3|nr:histone, subunit A domain-containing protein [Trichomonas vaginalis G3]EAY06847.1 hypothetical protein TVAG_340250 [Trichomonas vaginalis G3]KAI5489213.1 histone, subunit A domain-containing protein [Trichomonas vaginalis G3]|eukprot:XP_001319070.1 hypothetical protein [Trichomonas vaginalis G3]
MTEEEIRLNPQRVKSVAKAGIGDTDVRLCQGSIEFLTEMTTEFIELMALAAIDNSERPKQYIDSTGVVKALRKLGFDSIVDELPDLSEYAEDMQKTTKMF